MNLNAIHRTQRLGDFIISNFDINTIILDPVDSIWYKIVHSENVHVVRNTKTNLDIALVFFNRKNDCPVMYFPKNPKKKCKVKATEYPNCQFKSSNGESITYSWNVRKYEKISSWEGLSNE